MNSHLSIFPALSWPLKFNKWHLNAFWLNCYPSNIWHNCFLPLLLKRAVVWALVVSLKSTNSTYKGLFSVVFQVSDFFWWTMLPTNKYIILSLMYQHTPEPVMAQEIIFFLLFYLRILAVDTNWAHLKKKGKQPVVHRLSTLSLLKSFIPLEKKIDVSETKLIINFQWESKKNEKEPCWGIFPSELTTSFSFPQMCLTCRFHHPKWEKRLPTLTLGSYCFLVGFRELKA